MLTSGYGSHETFNFIDADKGKPTKLYTSSDGGNNFDAQDINLAGKTAAMGWPGLYAGCFLWRCFKTSGGHFFAAEKKRNAAPAAT